MAEKGVVCLVFLLMSCTYAIGASFCAIHVVVENETGGTLAGIAVVVRHSDGRIAARKVADNNRAEFCELDFDTYTVTASANWAYSAEMHSVRIVPDVEQTLTLFLNRYPVQLMGQAGNACLVHLRVVSEERMAIPGAVLSGRQAYELSENGFSETLVRIGSTETFTASAPGYTPQTTTVRCERFGLLQNTIVLKPER